MANLKQRLASGELLILDGAIGMELQRLGVPMHETVWCAVALRDHTDTVRQLHEDYIRAGADVITVNTFSSARYVLEPAGLGPLAHELNTRAVALAVEARERAKAGRPIHIAGVLSRFGLPRAYTDVQVQDALQEQADIQARAGADLMLLEFLGGPLPWIAAAARAAQATGLPVWVAMSAQESDVDKRVQWGGPPKRSDSRLSRIVPGSRLLFRESRAGEHEGKRLRPKTVELSPGSTPWRHGDLRPLLLTRTGPA
jgi:S-methylmethionine-dependent homocysteine/selenocysteine methylase